jgi:hypothetical protein
LKADPKSGRPRVNLPAMSRDVPQDCRDEDDEAAYLIYEGRPVAGVMDVQGALAIRLSG